MSKKHTLENIYKNFQAKTGYGMVVGVEQEFYLREYRHCEESTEGSILLQSSVNNEERWVASKPSLRSADISKALSAFPFFSEVEEEKGEGQFEVQISPTDNPAVMADMVNLLRKLVSEESRKIESRIKQEPSLDSSILDSHFLSFAAKPYPDQPGSGMHININLTDSAGNNLFSKNGEEESAVLEYAIAGLLELMPASMKYFAPYEDAYIRYTEHGMEAPSTVSWGADNRTVSLRIPSVPLTPHTRRIEHRISCADADPYLAIAAIIAGVEFGVVNKLENKHPKIWGNAFLPQYALPKLPANFEEAQNIHNEYLDMVMGVFTM